WLAVLGIAADFLTVSREWASVIDVALGERAQYFLVRDTAALDVALNDPFVTFSGRVTFLPLGTQENQNQTGHVDRFFEAFESGGWDILGSTDGVPSHPGVVARADRFVSCNRPDLSGLPFRLLGTTLIVQDLATARTLSASTGAFRFVTLLGDVLESDGTLT